MKTIFSKLNLKYGIIMGLGFCLYTTIMWLTKLDSTHLKVGKYFDILIILLPISIILIAIKKENSLSKLNILQRIFIAIYVSAISFIIYAPFLYCYHNYINPDWFNFVLDLKKEELISTNMSKTQIDTILNEMKIVNDAQNKLFRLSALIPSVIIIPSIIALFSLVFIRKKNNLANQSYTHK